MIKVFLVEDEVVMRNGIKNNIPWEKEGFEFVGEASDGELAYPLIKREKPDILITDIKMPFMDGLELSRLVKKELPQIKILILSGYNEFEYAQSAINIGVTDYLLKPIGSAKLLEAVKRIAEIIEVEREQERILERYQKEISDVRRMRGTAGEEIDVRDLHSKKSEQEQVEKFLKNGTIEEISDFVEKYFARVGEKNYQSLLFRQYIVMDLFVVVTDFLQNLGIENEELPEDVRDIGTTLTQIAALQEMKCWLKHLFTEAMRLRDCRSMKRYDALLEEAKAFIQQNYQKDEMSLQTVAAQVNVSPSYFSAIFSAETGQTFIEYLTSVRLEKAKELLMCSSLRTSEIGYEVGYKDSHYFSYIFKKVVGCSPKEYKNRRKEQDL
ncbi:MAG: response regulator [Blautia sp.]|nr:response regulator [Blautia sp.]